MKKMKIKPNMEMMTDIEATMVLAVFEYAKNEGKRKGVDFRTLIHNFAEALLLREMFVNTFPDLGDYPSEEEISALFEKALILAVEMEEGHE